MQIAALILLCAAVLAALAWSLRDLRTQPWWRPAVLAALRLAVVAALVTAWAGPRREEARTALIPPGAALVVDDSRSMSLPEGTGDETRHAAGLAAAQTLEGYLTTGAPAGRVAWANLSGGLQWASGAGTDEPLGAATDLRAALRGLAAEGPRAAVLISDGADTEGARAGCLVALSRAWGLALGTVGVGSTSPPADIAVDHVAAPRRVRAGSVFELTATVRAPGFQGLGLEAEVLREGRRVRALPFTGAATARLLRAPLQAGEPGRVRYTVRVPPQEGEITTANNSRTVLVEVVPDKPTVLVLAGAPSMEYAHLKRTLLADENLQARLVVMKSPPDGFWRDDETVDPVRLDLAGELARADAVLLQNLPPDAGGDLPRRLEQFVEDGGGLGVLGGPALDHPGYAASPLADLLPARPGAGGYAGEVFQVTRGPGTGALSRALETLPLGALPSMRGRNALTGVRSGASVALQANGAPLLVTRQVGAGRVLLLATDGTHRWVFSPEGDEQTGERALADLWGAILDWLTEVRDRRPVVAEFDRDVYQAGEAARLLVQVTDSSFEPVTDAAVTGELLTPGTVRRVTCYPSPGHPGRYEAVITAEREGPLTVRVRASAGGRELGTDEAGAGITPVLRELAGGRADLRLLHALGEGSGGGYAGASASLAVVEALDIAPETVERVTERRAARGPGTLALVITLLALDWGLRRRWRTA